MYYPLRMGTVIELKQKINDSYNDLKSLVDQKLLSDKYYSDAKSKAFLRRGYSLNKIRYNSPNCIDPSAVPKNPYLKPSMM